MLYFSHPYIIIMVCPICVVGGLAAVKIRNIPKKRRLPKREDILGEQENPQKKEEEK
jgi:hypothetical protein